MPLTSVTLGLLPSDCTGAIAMGRIQKQSRLSSYPFPFWPWLTIVLLGMGTPAMAQVRADDTLAEPSRVEVRSPRRSVVRDGTRRDRTLFHSFQEFSVPTRGRVSFQGIDPEINLILTRVTGNRASRINGVLEVLQANGTLSSADFFLLNPNGIVFGPEANLRLGGSFLATTAESFVFENDARFSATRPRDVPQLILNVPLGLQFGSAPAPIQNASLVDVTGDRWPDGLTLQPNRTLALIGGPVTLSGGGITVPGGRIELGAVGANSEVAIQPTATGFQLDYDQVQAFQAVRLQDLAIATVDGNGNRGIHIQGDRVILQEEAILSAGTFGNRDGDRLTLQANQLHIDDFSLITTFTEGSGNAGDIDIQVRSLTAQAGGQIASLTSAAGNAGNIQVLALDSVRFSGGEIFQGEFLPTGILSQVLRRRATGNSGTITLQTDFLQLREGAQISTTTFGQGDAGDLQVNVRQADLSGSALTPQGQLFKGKQGQRYGSGLYTSSEASATGNGGNLDWTGNQLRLRDGAVLQTVTFSSGDAGNLTLRLAERVEVAGIDQEGLFPTSLVAASGGIPDANALFTGVQTATGQAGNLVIQTPDLRVLDGGAIAVGSLNPNLEAQRNSGNLRIQADTIRLERRGRLLAETASGDGGNITIGQNRLLLLRQGSQISTTAGTEQAGGDGGDINIRADFILSVLVENNDITANAFAGDGGNVNITTESLIGIQFQPAPTPNSDITASSQFGLDGNVVINTLDIDPTQGVVELPGDLLDASRLVRQECAGINQRNNTPRSELYVTGRGGLPDIPDEVRSRESLNTPWVEVPAWAVSGLEAGAIASTIREEDASEESLNAESLMLVETQGWQVNDQGQIALVFSMPAAPGIPRWIAPVFCP
jgi:filamentous hemagglutinin family protein